MMGFDDARHLAARTGLGPRLDEVLFLASLTRAQAVDHLLDGLLTAPRTEAPEALDDTPDPEALAADKKKARKRLNKTQRKALKTWWVAEMLDSPSPLTERLTLFWHGHFTSALQKVKRPRLLWQQHLALRAHAAGDFSKFLHAISRDPAMLLYLDGQRSQRDRPNENFARELLELFTLGPPHYTEADIAAGALAFTGWHVNPQTGETRFDLSDQDMSTKTFLGQTGPWVGANILDIILKHPALPASIAQKLWSAFVSQPPPAAMLASLAQTFSESGLQIKPLLRAILLSDPFWAADERGQRIKSPVELLVGAARALTLDPGDDLPALLAVGCQRLGQDLFNPPSVKGWPQGRDWINTQTLHDRFQALEQLTRWEPLPSLTDLTKILGPEPARLLLAPAPNSPTLSPADDALTQLDALLSSPHIHLV